MSEVPYAADRASSTLRDSDTSLGSKAEYVEPHDFDDFWAISLTQARSVGPDLRRTAVSTGLRTVDVDDVVFPGWAGQSVRGWLIRPSGVEGPLPLVVQYIGYRGGRGLPIDHLAWASAGFAHFVMDSRGQGGDTPDLHLSRGGPDGSHVLRGLDAPAHYYYRRLIIDAVRAVDCLVIDPCLDADRVIVTGASQGGGLALAVTALHESVSLLLCDIPFLCDWRRGVDLAERGPYAEVNAFCATHREKADAVFSTLAYFDGLAFATRATAVANFSVALRDRVCPPATVQGVYERFAGPKTIAVHPYNDHEGGGSDQLVANILAASARLKADAGRTGSVQSLPITGDRTTALSGDRTPDRAP